VFRKPKKKKKQTTGPTVSKGGFVWTRDTHAGGRRKRGALAPIARVWYAATLAEARLARVVPARTARADKPASGHDPTQRPEAERGVPARRTRTLNLVSCRVAAVWVHG
jgi:hypothetical protein